TLSIFGRNLRTGAGVKLRRTGEPDIVGSGIIVGADGSSLTGTFDLAGVVAGAWDVVVTNPDAQIATLPAGFTVTPVAAPELRVDVLGPPLIRALRRTAYDLVIQNPGNIDALDVPLWLYGLPTDVTVEFEVQ